MLEDNLNFHLPHEGMKMCVLIKLHIIDEKNNRLIYSYIPT